MHTAPFQGHGVSFEGLLVSWDIVPAKTHWDTALLQRKITLVKKGMLHFCLNIAFFEGMGMLQFLF